MEPQHKNWRFYQEENTHKSSMYRIKSIYQEIVMFTLKTKSKTKRWDIKRFRRLNIKKSFFSMNLILAEIQTNKIKYIWYII